MANGGDDARSIALDHPYLDFATTKMRAGIDPHGARKPLRSLPVIGVDGDSCDAAGGSGGACITQDSVGHPPGGQFRPDSARMARTQCLCVRQKRGYDSAFTRTREPNAMSNDPRSEDYKQKF